MPLPLPGTFTYSIAEELYIDVGFRVIVPFGQSKYYTGVVYKIHDENQIDFNVKEILDVLDDSPIITRKQLNFIEWISKYYMCSLGEAYNAALPSALKLKSESTITFHPDVDLDGHILDERETTLLNWLQQKDLTFKEASEILELKYPQKIINNLNQRGLITVFEKVKDRYTSKKEVKIRISPYLIDGLDDLAIQLEKKRKQYEILMYYLQEVEIFEDIRLNERGISKKELLAEGFSASALNTLIKNRVLEKFETILDRFAHDGSETQALKELTKEQTSALESIQTEFNNKKPVLLKGITGSGKTEIYMKLIEEVVKGGQQALLLLPEIALTTQIISRFRKYFGSRFGVYHSRFSDNERVEIYQKLIKMEFDFIIGVRSSVFLPFSNLGLIIVDEEHESSYKQYEPSPRYHARDAAIVLAGLHSANILLGSATPSLESIFNVKNKKYAQVNLTKRYGDLPLPKLEIANLQKARKQKKIKGNFTHQLLEEIDQTIEKNKQVILFYNRRGYSPFIQCDECNHIPQCPNCDVSLTYHIFRNELMCHYCGHHRSHVPKCISCNSENIQTVGAGTEKIEEELELLRPELKIQRMDLDTTRTKNAYQNIIDDFENQKMQVLTGTQMVTKGLDFENVDLVGIIDADKMIHFPDFRSHERAYQMIQQVSGRAGRKHNQGTVILQTSTPNHPVIQAILTNSEEAFIEGELIERQEFDFPPFNRMINIILRSRHKETVWEAANYLSVILRKDLTKKRVFGPVVPHIGRIRNNYLVNIHIKIEKSGVNLPTIKEYLLSSRDTLLALQSFKGVQVYFDVDPY